MCVCCLQGVVVIDDQPEVSIDDPAFLFETNEGFQEVTSKKAQKNRQKAAQEEMLKKQTLEQKKKEKDQNNKVRVCPLKVSSFFCWDWSISIYARICLGSTVYM